MSNAGFIVGNRRIGPGQPPWIVAEISANHQQSLARAEELIRAAAAAGADAVKMQTYTADTLTLACDLPPFQLEGTVWAGRTLHALYREAYTPWEWQPQLKALAESLGLVWFSSPFDDTAVDFLESLDTPVYKIASFELVDIGLLQRVAATGRPIVLSTGMASLAEIDEAVRTLRRRHSAVALLQCTSAYPATADDMHLRGLPWLADAFDLPVGLSDHSLDPVVPVVATALGAVIIEKHFTLRRGDGGADAAFSLEPAEFAAMATAVRAAYASLGQVRLENPAEASSRRFRRSLYIAEDVSAGERFTPRNVRSIRPAGGLHTRHLPEILGRCAAIDVKKGTPLEWRHVSDPHLDR